MAGLGKTRAIAVNQCIKSSTLRRRSKLKQDAAQIKAVIRATFEAMDFNRKEKSWMIN